MLSEEEKKAIKLLEDIKNNSWTTKYIMSSDSKNADILLNLITKLQKENEHWKNGFERELQDNRKNTCELLKQDLIIRQKDKQIDLMAEKIHFLGSEYDDFCIDTVWNEDCDKDCKNCIKQYFERKVKDGRD